MKHSFTLKKLSALEDLRNLTEDHVLEFKSALGENGKGKLPKDFFSSYSALANTNGGTIVLGVKQLSNSKGGAELVGILEPEKVLKELWDTINNSQKASVNLLSNAHVIVSAVPVISNGSVETKNIIIIRVPRANRPQMPVFINGNPYGGTYRRNFEGDYKCSVEEVDRMIAEKQNESRDFQLLALYKLTDLDAETLKAYRNNFKNNQPDHPYNSLDDTEFLETLKAYRKDRESGQDGLTLAGLLMFGKSHIIQEVLPNYYLDYQEKVDNKPESRWIDRITVDGSWSGNLFDFYRKVIQKLYSGLKVEFRLKQDARVSSTPVHEALREALVNSLIHADYTGTSPILVLKMPDKYAFQNPGTMRVSLEDAKRGVNSDCRNRSLQHMFFMVGFSDKAGTGIPKIFSNWEKQQYRPPIIVETVGPDETHVQLPTVSLISAESLNALQERFGSDYRQRFSNIEVLALIRAIEKGYVTHADVKEACSDHSREVTLALSKLVKKKILESGGSSPKKYYFFHDAPPSFHWEDELQHSDDTYEDLYSWLEQLELDLKLPDLPDLKLPDLPDLKLPDLPDLKLPDLPDLKLPDLPDLKLPDLPDLKLPVFVSKYPDAKRLVRKNDKQTKSGEKVFTKKIISIAEPARQYRKLPSDKMKALILQICQTGWFTPSSLGLLLHREAESLRQAYIKLMHEEGFLEGKFPKGTTDPRQAYKTTEKGKEWLNALSNKPV